MISFESQPSWGARLMVKKPMIFCSIFILMFLCGFVGGQETWLGDQQGLWSFSPSESHPLSDLPADLRCIARTPSGGGWVALADINLILHVDPTGDILETIDTVVGVQGLVVDSQGSVWATRPGMDDVIVIEPGNGIVAYHPVATVPYGITINQQGQICVTCSYSNQVQILSPSGDLLQQIPVGFFPTGITAAHDGGLWIAEKDGLRKLDSSGETTWSGSAGVFPIGVTTDLQGRAWFSCQNSHQVVVVDGSGVVNIIDVPARPLGISGNGDGSVTVLCRNGNSVVRISSTGQILDQITASYPVGTGDLSGLQRVLMVDPDGDMDGDGVANAVEAQLGFNPLNDDSCPVTFVRGDANRDGMVDFTDGIDALIILFGAGSTNCLESLDVDDDGRLTLADPIRILDHVLASGPAPEFPYPDLGPDLDPDQGFPCFP
ncbi:MAG: hypothetical protein VYD70_09020 [Planctomycetota bacterium]|nr:hypothetical protein [Planctomycetota bacterium]